MDDKTAAFRDFWPYYLQEHAHAGTRAMHYAGTSLVVLLIAALPVAGKWWMIPAMPLAGYGFAWIGHSLIEHNRPATRYEEHTSALQPLMRISYDVSCLTTKTHTARTHITTNSQHTH